MKIIKIFDDDIQQDVKDLKELGLTDEEINGYFDFYLNNYQSEINKLLQRKYKKHEQN